jgi:hypothetical protein
MPQGVVVYAGKGCSHSWTWLADLFEASSLWEARFLDEHDFVRSLGEDCSVAVVSGGDAHAIASALSGKGFSELERFIGSGGCYVGVCAGAYLPLPTSVPPLCEFNLCSARIENIMPTPVEPRTASPRLSVPFCDRMIIHPIRGEVAISFGERCLNAPVYGGPIFREPSGECVVGRFFAFTESTEIQVDREVAEGMVLGRPAVIEAMHRGGKMLLLSPHLEHPRYPAANRLFMDLLDLPVEGSGGVGGTNLPGSPQKCGLSRAVADLSVALMGLEGRSFLVGDKMWDSERFMVLVEAIRRRSAYLPQDVAESLSLRVRAVRRSIMSRHSDSEDSIDATLDSLIAVARDCVNLRFEQMSAGR